MRGSLALLLISATAIAAPAARQRVVLADPDPELRHAMEQALAPWRLAVVIDGAAPASPAAAEERADADTARFVVWRDGDELVVYDRELATLERRASRAGALDPLTAAAAALTIKTMMRLPPPPPPEPAEPVAAVAVEAALARGPAIRLAVGAAARLAGGDAGGSARATVAALVRPTRALGLRLGVLADLGTASDVSRAGFKGQWRDWGVLAVASWSLPIGGWAVEPFAAAGVRHETLDGEEMAAARTEAATHAAARAGAALRWGTGRWSLAAELAIDAVFGTSTYHRLEQPPVIFQAPGVAGVFGAALAIEL